MQNDPEGLKNELLKIGHLVFFSILFSTDCRSVSEGEEPKFFGKDDLSDYTFDEALKLIIQKESNFLWQKYGK